jgi:uncharacterized protein involved in exopolysaccharide biosynthesis
MSSSGAPATSSVSIARYAAILARRWKIVVAGVVLGSLGAVGYLVLLGQTYTAQADVNINIISTDPFNASRSASGLLDATTEAQLAMSFAVAGIAAEELGVGALELRSATQATVVPDATVIRIRYSASNAPDAIKGADAIAQAYLSYRSAQADARLAGILASISERIEALRAQLADANARISATLPGSSEQAEAISDRDLVTLELNNLLSSKTATESVDTAGGSLLSSAGDNEVGVAPGRTLTLVTGALAGLALGAIGAFAVNRARARVTGREEVETTTGVPVVQTLHTTKASIPASDRDLDDIRTVRERILNTLDPVGRVILVVDDTAGPMGSDVPLNLGIAFAETGQLTRVILPGLASTITSHLRNSVRFSVSRAKNAIPSTLLSSRFTGLRLIIPPGNGSGQLMTPQLRRILAEQAEDVVTLLVLPPMRDEASLLAAARSASAVLFVVESGMTRRTRAEASGQLAGVQGTVALGSVLVPKGRQIVMSVLGLGDSERLPRTAAVEPALSEDDPAPSDELVSVDDAR